MELLQMFSEFTSVLGMSTIGVLSTYAGVLDLSIVPILWIQNLLINMNLIRHIGVLPKLFDSVEKFPENSGHSNRKEVFSVHQRRDIYNDLID